jgi:hypothetical protein
MRDGLRPIRPYYWQVNGRQLLEIPVTTVPVLRLPMHMSYLFGLSRFAPQLAIRYFDVSLRLCRLTNIEPSMVLHPTDFLGVEDRQGLSFIPGMELSLRSKLECVGAILDRLKRAYSVVTLRDHAAIASRRSSLPALNPSF